MNIIPAISATLGGLHTMRDKARRENCGGRVTITAIVE